MLNIHFLPFFFLFFFFISRRRENEHTKSLSWHFSPKKEKHINKTQQDLNHDILNYSDEKNQSQNISSDLINQDEIYEESLSMSSDDRNDNDLPPILAHMDLVALRKWSSLASSDIRSMKLGQKHSNLQITSMMNENERLRHELLEANIAKSQVYIWQALFSLICCYVSFNSYFEYTR